MKYWKISENSVKDYYLIFNDKSIWFSELSKNKNIDIAIKNRELENTLSHRYNDLKEIIFIDTNSSMNINFKDREMEKKEVLLDHKNFNEIKDLLIQKLKGTVVKDFSIFKQISPILLPAFFTIFFTFISYSAAIDIENGETMSTSGRKALFKLIFATLIEVLGSFGILIIGILIFLILMFFTFKIYKNPKKGTVIKIKKTPELQL